MGNLLGSSMRYSTWAALRSPMWKGSGYRDEAGGANKNMGKYNATGTAIGNNMVYAEALGPLSVAFPFCKNQALPYYYWANSMCLGLTNVVTQWGNDEYDIPFILDFYLAHGQGIWHSSDVTEQVINGYTYSPDVTTGLIGYDTLRAREQYRDAVVNVTFTPGPTLDPVTTDVTITDDLFPDDLNWWVSSTQGVYIGTYEWPVPHDGLTWDQPYWTINSLTMP
jgi:hypothetical protein